MQLVAKETITSLELVEQINYFRKQEGKLIELQHKTLLEIIRDEFEEEIQEQKILLMSYMAKIGNGARRKQPMFVLTLSQAKQVLVRESKFVRRAIINYIEKLEQQLPVPVNSSVMIPLDKVQYWNKIKELSDMADERRSEIYYKLKLLSKMVVSITTEVDRLSDIVFETEHYINKIEGKDMNLNTMLKI